MIFSEEDVLQLKKRGISLEEANQQIKNFQSGFPFATLVQPATIDNGIRELQESKTQYYVDYFKEHFKDKKIVKFVPASGAASRMFKAIFQYITDQNDSETEAFLKEFEKLAFADDLIKKAKANNWSIDTNTPEGLVNIAKLMVGEAGLDYGDYPKGYIQFHEYEEGSRSAFEEHLVEGALYAKQNDGSVNIHFTISPAHKETIEKLINETKVKYEKQYSVTYNISFSEQQPHTDTIAVDLNNQPFRENGELLFRPGGHGALIENLGSIDADIIFVKNIDNVIVDRLKDQTIRYKKVIAGYLMAIQDRTFDYLKKLDEGLTNELVVEINIFCNERLGIHGVFNTKEELVSVLNRPIRVCGMVKNEGEPGGGPFWVRNHPEDAETLQIIESSQVDQNNPHQVKIVNESTHFNPVDLVCGIKDYKGQPFDLKKFIDYETGFISYKSKAGKEIKQQELPGLWNGSMAGWTTIFIEVPLITFNPVKTVADLLRKEHLPD